MIITCICYGLFSSSQGCQKGTKCTMLNCPYFEYVILDSLDKLDKLLYYAGKLDIKIKMRPPEEMIIKT